MRNEYQSGLREFEHCARTDTCDGLGLEPHFNNEERRRIHAGTIPIWNANALAKAAPGGVRSSPLVSVLSMFQQEKTDTNGKGNRHGLHYIVRVI